MTAAGTAPEAAALQEVAPGVHAWVQPDGTWWINNAGVVEGPAGTLLVDTCATEERTRRLLAAVGAATGGAPVTAAVNTHQHGDHTYGNCLLPGDAVLVGHQAMRAALAVDIVIEGCPAFWDPVPDWGAVTRRLPDVTVAGGLTLHRGDRVVEVHHPGGPAHTPGDLVVWLPEERVLFTGDLVFAGLTPLVLMGSVAGARRSLDWLAGFEPAVVVPGHGPVLGADQVGDVLADHDRYYATVEAAARLAVERGLTPLDAAGTTDLGDMASWPDAERLVLNLHRAIAELEGREPDVVAAFLDAVEWNGGPLPTAVCCAA